MQALQKPRALFPIFLLLFLGILAAPLSADIIYLKNGKQIRGKFHGALDGLYQITLDDGRVQYIPEEEVRDVEITSEKTSISSNKSWLSWLPRDFSSLKYHFLIASGLAEVKYSNAGLAESQAAFSELDLDVSGEGQTKYPNSHSGLALQAAAKVGLPMGPGTDLELGLDLSLLPANGADSPQTRETSFLSEQGDIGQVEITTKQLYSYSYFTMMLGLTSYLQALDLYLSYYLRMTLTGSYSVQEESLIKYSLPSRGIDESIRESSSAKGSISGRPFGLGLVLQKKDLFYWKKRAFHLNFLCSMDALELQGGRENSKARKEFLFFYGAGLSMDF